MVKLIGNAVLAKPPRFTNFEGRFKWWVNKADELGIPGTGNSNDRLTIAARIIHPTKKKVCLVCGKEHYVGYMYMNANFAKSWNALTGKRHAFLRGWEGIYRRRSGYGK